MTGFFRAMRLLRTVLALVLGLAAVPALAQPAATVTPPAGFPLAGPTPANPYEPGDLAARTILYPYSLLDAGAIVGDGSLGGWVRTGLTATGSGCGSSPYNTAALPAFLQVFSTVAGGNAAQLTAVGLGQLQIVVNQGSSPLTLCPALGSGGTVDGGSSISLAANGGFAIEAQISATAWQTVSGGAGGGGGGGIPSTTSILCGAGAVNTATPCPSLLGMTATGQVLYGTGPNEAIAGATLGQANGPAKLDGSGVLPCAQLPVSVCTVQLVFSYIGVPGASALRQTAPLPYSCAFSANLAGSSGWANVASTSTAGFALQTVTPPSATPTTIGTVNWVASSQPTLPTLSGATIPAGTLVQMVAPSSPDATLADISFGLVCARS